MSNPLYDASVPVFAEKLRDMSAILDKATTWIDARGLTQDAVAATRIYPDMHPLSGQAGAVARFPVLVTALLTGSPPPMDRFLPLEEAQPFDHYTAWMAVSLEFLSTLRPDQFDAAADRRIDFPIKGAPCSFSGSAFLFRFGMPNFMFHATTLYLLLRQIGVPVGKSDFVLPEFAEGITHFE